LSEILELLGSQPRETRDGRALVRALAQSANDDPLPSARAPALQFLERASYVQAVCWIGACLADALQYAHQRWLMHLDLKPSNVLLAADGQPMLLDFHIAREFIDAGSGPLERLGGTPSYMSPEQSRAVESVRAGRSIEQAVDGRSDIYSLGLLLSELLTGGATSGSPTALRQGWTSQAVPIPRGVQDMLLKCLAANPAERYATASELANDLRRHLADLPLRGVPNRSLGERYSKWRRRRPLALGVAFLGGLLLMLVGAGVWRLVADRREAAEAALRESQQLLDHGAFVEAERLLNASRKALNWLPGEAGLKTALNRQALVVRRASLAEALHQLAEQLRFVEDVSKLSDERVRSLLGGGESLWANRSQWLEPRSGRLDDKTEAQLKTDALDLAIFTAEASVARAPPDGAHQARVAALARLIEAEAACGSNAVLEHVRRDLQSRDGQPPATTPLPPARTSWEHVALGHRLLAEGKLSEAQGEIDRALALEPGAFWPNWLAMQCHYRAKRYAAAVNSACACVALRPTSAECFYNRALAYRAASQPQDAIADSRRALTLRPAFTPAALTLAELLGDRGEKAEALEILGQALAHAPGDQPAVELRRRLEALP
jgi:tetratricopeptide (TPR) repeat protein